MDLQSILTFLTLVCVPSTLMNECGNSDNSADAFFFTVVSRRNSSGHRITAKVDLPEGSRVYSRNTKRTALDVEQKAYVQNGHGRIQLQASFVVLDERRPPPGYELVPGVGWYRLHLTLLTWEEARLACEAEGAHLAVLNSQEEANALKAIFARAPDNIPNTGWNFNAFVGFSDRNEGQYLTIFGETLKEAGFDSWHSDQPNNEKSDTDPDQDCGGVHRSEGKLNDLPCRAKLAYFCEYSDIMM